MASGRRGTLATVVRVRGSAYRRPGARMFLVEDGRPVGLVSGGCLEEDLAERAVAVLAEGRPRTVVYDMRSPDDIVWGLGLGCNGEVRVLLERIDPPGTPAWLRFLGDCDRRRRAGLVATVFDREGDPGYAIGQHFRSGGTESDPLPPGEIGRLLAADAREALQSGRTRVGRYESSEGSIEVLLEAVVPVPRLLIFGAGQDAEPVVRFAAALGWAVAVFDHRPGYLVPERFPAAESVHHHELGDPRPASWGVDDRTAVVLMTHHFPNDSSLLPALLETPAAYVGLLGPRARAERLLRSAGAAERAARVFGPVGLDIGAETPEEIALSMLAEIQAVFAGREGGFLRDRDRPLHDPPE